MEIVDRLGIEGDYGSVLIVSDTIDRAALDVLLFLARHRSSKHVLVSKMM
jgi:hypothetical protein